MLPLLSACFETIEMDFPAHQPRPVINALFTPDSVWQVDVTTSKSLNYEDAYDTIPNATIEIFEGDIRVDSLIYLGGTTYRSSQDRKPREGEEYTLRFSAPGYPDCYATDRVPVLPEMEFISLDTVAANPMFYLYGEKVVVTVLIKDRPEPNFYYTNVFDFSRGSIGFQNSYHNPPISAIEFGYRKVFSDQVFNGKNHRLIFDYENFNDGETFIDIGIVSGSYFRYAKDYEEHLYDQLEMLATPSDVYSNVEGGFGIFAAYYSLTFRVRE
ncbi:MAG: DUF4249 domain-containing protein [Cyclobacteriaceae bacterium]